MLQCRKELKVFLNNNLHSPDAKLSNVCEVTLHLLLKKEITRRLYPNTCNNNPAGSIIVNSEVLIR